MLKDIQATGDGYLTRFHPRFQQTYHSKHGALREAQYVFLRESLVEERLRQGRRTRILEVGFGLGLNFMLTSRMAQKTATPIVYTALECDLLDAEQLSKMRYAELLDVQPLGMAFYAWRAHYPDPMPVGTHHFSFGAEIQLQLLMGDALNAKLQGEFDAVYLDAFSPDTNPELWTADFLCKLARVMAPEARLATYSAKGAVRRALQEAGLEVFKRPGPPGKRDMLTAIKPA